MELQIEILFQDEYFIIVNKPSGMLVHYYKECTDTSNLLKVLRQQTGHYLYPLHRLDRPVSGIVVFSIDKKAAGDLKNIWNTNLVEKHYTALVRREITEPGVFNFDLSNEKKVKQTAITNYYPLESFGKWNTLLRVTLETGRKHQIRRHFSRRCHHILGDTAHGKGKINHYFREQYGLNRIFLHAHYFKFLHPILEKEIEIHCPLPIELESVLSKLRERIEPMEECEERDKGYERNTTTQTPPTVTLG